MSQATSPPPVELNIPQIHSLYTVAPPLCLYSIIAPEDVKGEPRNGHKTRSPRPAWAVRGNGMEKGGYLLSRLAGSTIGEGGLNFSVRDGKRWDTAAIATMMDSNCGTRRGRGPSVGHKSNKQNERMTNRNAMCGQGKPRTAKAFGLLVVLGFGVAAFTPAPYPRHRL